jgi:hypothetical protein
MNRKAVLILVAGTIAVVAIGTTGFALQPFVRRALIEPPTDYKSISIGNKKSEVEYKLGIPTAVLKEPEANDPYYPDLIVYKVGGDELGANSLPKGDDFTKYLYWVYPGPVTVQFDKGGSVQSVDCTSLSIVKDACPPLLGMRIGDTEEHLSDVLGIPNYAKYDNTTKAVFYQKWGVEFILEKQKVYSMKMLRLGPSPWKTQH